MGSPSRIYDNQAIDVFGDVVNSRIIINKNVKRKATPEEIYFQQKENIVEGAMLDASRNTLYSYSGSNNDTSNGFALSKSSWLYPTNMSSPAEGTYDGRDSSSSITMQSISSGDGANIAYGDPYIHAEKNRIATQASSFQWSRSDHFMIGTVALRIPPTHIRVSNEPHNYRHSTLRSPGEVTMSSGRATTRIELNIVFNGLEDINQNLRSLVAQFKTTPFLPIESSYLKNILNPFNRDLEDDKYAASLSKQVEGLTEADNRLKQLLEFSARKDVTRSSIRERIAALKKDGYITNDFSIRCNEFITNPENIPTSDIVDGDKRSDGSVDLYKWISRHVTIPSNRPVDAQPVINKSLSEIQSLQQEVENINKMSSDVYKDAVEAQFKDRQLVCVLSQMAISTVQDMPETLSCALSLYVFNYDPFTIDYSFISDNGDVTPDITKCALFIDWYTKRWLSEKSGADSQGLSVYSSDQSMRIAYFSHIPPVDERGKSVGEELQTKFISIDSGMVVTGITVSFKNVIQFIPVLSLKNPTCQYMGSMNNEVGITFECVNDVKINEFSQMIETIGAISRNVNRVTRYNYIYIDNPLLASMGMSFFTIDNHEIDTVQGAPGLTYVNLSLVEYKIGQEEFQRLNREGVTSQKEIEFVARHTLQRARDYQVSHNPEDKYYYDIVCHKNTGWFRSGSDPIKDFVFGAGTWTEQNKQVVKTIKQRASDLAKKTETFGLDIGLFKAFTMSPVAAGPSIIGGSGTLRAFEFAESFRVEQYSREFLKSINNPTNNKQEDLQVSGVDSFFDDNVDLAAKALSILRRDDIVNMILTSEKRTSMSSVLGNALNTSGNSIDSKEIQDSGVRFCYPDLELPKYGDIADGYRLKTSLYEAGQTRNDRDESLSRQSDAVEVDADFYMSRGSLWGSIEKSQSTKQAVSAGLSWYKRLALSNQRYRLTEAMSEDVASKLLSDTRQYDLKDKLVSEKFMLSAKEKQVIESGPVKVISVHDGDTFKIEVNGKEYNVRVLGYDSPEVASSANKKVTDIKKAGVATRDLSNLLRSGDVFIDISTGETDSYNRLLANVTVVKNNTQINVANEMLKNYKLNGCTNTPSADNPLDDEARIVYLKSHEIYIRRVLDKKKTNISWQTLMTDPESYRSAFNAITGVNPVLWPARLIGNSIFTVYNTAASFLRAPSQNAAEIYSDNMDQVGIGAAALTESVPFLDKFLLQDNVIQNTPADSVAKAFTTETSNINLNRFDREAPKNIEALARKIKESQKDDSWRMSRAFPAFKVYFIEEDMPEWGRLDDMYSYHAVASMSVTRSRVDPADTAVISFFNTKGTLDRQLFGLYDKSGNYFGRSQDEKYNIDKQETSEEQDLSSFILKPGTIIKIKMGYSSDPDLLDTVFTGMVSEVQGGDIINVVAHGFGVELLQPVPATFRMISAEGASKVLNQLMLDPIVKHFGSTEWFPATDDTVKTVYRRFQFNPHTKTWESKSWWRRIAGIDYVLRLRDNRADNNIWTREIGVWYSLTHGGFQSLVLKDKTIWDVFREMQLRYPGNIAAVVPFDNRATVYFGPSEFLYTYTAQKEDEKRLWNTAMYERLGRSSQEKLDSLVNEFGYSKVSDDIKQSDLNYVGSAVTQYYNLKYTNTNSSSDKQYSEADNLSKVLAGKEESYSDVNRAISFLETSLLSIVSTMPKDSQDGATRAINVMSSSLRSGKHGIYSMSRRGGDYSAHFSIAEDSSEDWYRSPSGESFTIDKAIERYDSLVADEYVSSNPSRKLIRDYHYKDSYHHIVSNGIVATSQHMYNKVTVEYGLEAAWAARRLLESAPGFDKVSAQIDDDIWPERVKEKFVQERNARDIITAWHYALGHLWEETRKMYTGHLTMLGDGSIKPNDIIMINDYFTDMHGPVEVEQVTHHFSPDTGFVTTIVPNLVCNVNNPLQQGSITVAGTYMDKTSEFVQNVRSVFSLATPLVGSLAAGVAFWMTGLSQSRREPISLTPLMYAGRPYIAGIEGMRGNTLIEAIAGNIYRAKLQWKRVLGTSGSVFEYVSLRAAVRGGDTLRASLNEPVITRR